MTTGQLPVVAAIPNYNMGENLRRLLPQVLAERYDAVFVLDDASTDESADVVSEFGDEVKFVRSPENRGAGANRNQIIDRVPDGVLIHFIDADMDLETPETPSVARELAARYAERGVGMIGGLVTFADGRQEWCNHGAVLSVWGNGTGTLQFSIDRLSGRPRLAGALRRVVAPAMANWPNTLEPPAPAPTYWVHEGNMLVFSTIFRSIGGFDPALRAQEIQELSIRLEKRGIKRQFDPSIKVVHHHIDVRGKNRSKWENHATRYMIRKHGLYRFLTDH
ncbi:glycosyltransferase family 2 protein [Mycobacterium sp.]|uniref:glycosyltransferase family 2 protein n=1 Tax=Mycobacterium sp. TaxID=1785 RepID=UPI003F9790E7